MYLYQKVYFVNMYSQPSRKYLAKEIMKWEFLDIYQHNMVNKQHFHQKLGNFKLEACQSALFYKQTVRGL